MNDAIAMDEFLAALKSAVESGELERKLRSEEEAGVFVDLNEGPQDAPPSAGD